MSNYTGNIGLLFNKYYFRDDKMKLDKDLLYHKDNDRIEIKNKLILTKKIESKNKFDNVCESVPWDSELKFKTIYPGLIIGSGLEHGIGVNGEFKQGFEFDYTTGLPVIHGSSVKGVLRSVFPYSKDDPLSEGKLKYINEILNKKFSVDDIEKIRDFIFEGKDEDANGRDIFFDAIVSNENENIVLSDDYITPHKNELKNPIPVRFIKVKPDVIFKFRFTLFSDEMLTKKEKLNFFKEILLDIGIGAKTNLGYGQFSREYTNAFFNKYLEKFKQKEKEQKEKELKTALDSAVGFEKIVLIYNNRERTDQEKEDELKHILDTVEDFENKKEVVEFLKREYEKIGKWSGKQSKKQKNKIKKIKRIIEN